MQPRAFPDPFAAVPSPAHAPELATDPEIEIDHVRLTALVDELERDVALIEGAMADVEAREFGSANAALDVLDGVASA